MALSEKRLRQWLKYDPETGDFTWLKKPPHRDIPVGARAGSTNARGYVCIGIGGKLYLAHRLAWLYMTGAWPSEEMDHRAGKNNKWKNLREASHRINMENLRTAQRNNGTGLLGVSRNRKRYRARITVDHQEKHLGTFDTPELAYVAYLEAKRALHEGCTI